MCAAHQVVYVPCYVLQGSDYCSFTEDEVSCFWSVLEHHSGSLESVGLKGMLPSVTSVECSLTLNFSCSSKQPFCVTYVIISMSINIHHTHSWQGFHTIAVSVNYFLSVCAGCAVSQSCVITILSKLPNLTALNFNRIGLPDNEEKVNLPNVQMQCIHVCAVTQPAQHACVYIVSCARCPRRYCAIRREGVSSIPSARFHGHIPNPDMHSPSKIVDWFYIEVHVATFEVSV